MATQQTSTPDPQQVAVGSKVAKPGLQGGASGRRAPLGDLSNTSARVQQRAQGKDGKQEATKDKSEQGHKEVMPARERSGSKKRPSLAGQSTSATKQPRIYSGRPQGQGQSKEHEVTAAEEEMHEAPHMQFLRFCSRLEKLVLVAIIMELQASGRDFVQIQAVLRRLTTHVLLICPLIAPRLCSLPHPSSLPPSPLGIPQDSVGSGTICQIVLDLASSHLVMAGPSWQGINANVALNVHKDDVATVIQEDPSLAALYAQL